MCVIFFIFKHIDYIAFEAMEIISSHPVTRFPSLHIAYALFKEHEDTIVEGCKIIKAKEDMGICIVNPSGNLPRMEKRLKLFIDFWLPQWASCYNTEPSEEMFENALVNHDILMYEDFISIYSFYRILFRLIIFFCIGIMVTEVAYNICPEKILKRQK